MSQDTQTSGLAGRKNLQQLIQLRWIAVVGQVATIIGAQWLFRIALPLPAMAVVLSFLVGLNILSLARLRAPSDVRNRELMLALLLDILALTGQLYLSGGATNPFISLFVMQVAVGAILLETWSTWIVVALAGLGFAVLTVAYLPLELPKETAGQLFRLHIAGTLICFLLDAGLIVVFMTRINRNLRARDARLANLRQQAAEEGHIVRMGLLASGAAHELGTPLATLSVILNDWRRVPALTSDPEFWQELQDMEAEVQRCKSIVTGILMSAGEARGEGTNFTTLKTFLLDVVEDWRGKNPNATLSYFAPASNDVAIVADSALKQVLFNVLDNAAEVSPEDVVVSALRHAGDLKIIVKDRGGGFPAEVLENLGRPYQSTKGRLGGGLGLFLVANVLRKLGGRLVAHNTLDGAEVVLTLPLSALAVEEDVDVG